MQLQNNTVTQLNAIITNAAAALAAMQVFAEHTQTQAYAGESCGEDVQCNAAMQVHLSAISEDCAALCNSWDVEQF